MEEKTSISLISLSSSDSNSTTDAKPLDINIHSIEDDVNRLNLETTVDTTELSMDDQQDRLRLDIETDKLQALHIPSTIATSAASASQIQRNQQAKSSSSLSNSRPQQQQVASSTLPTVSDAAIARVLMRGEQNSCLPLPADVSKVLLRAQEINSKLKKKLQSNGDEKAQYETEVHQVLASLKDVMKTNRDETAKFMIEKEMIGLPMTCILPTKPRPVIMNALYIFLGLSSKAGSFINIFNRYKILHLIGHLVGGSLMDEELLELILHVLSSFALEGRQEACEAIMESSLDDLFPIIRTEVLKKDIERETQERENNNKLLESKADQTETEIISHEKNNIDDVQSLTSDRNQQPPSRSSTPPNKQGYALLYYCSVILRCICEYSSNPNSQSSAKFNIQRILPALAGLLSVDNLIVALQASWALSHLCDGPDYYVAEIMRYSPEMGKSIPEMLIEFLDKDPRIIKPSLRALGNIVCCEEDIDTDQKLIDKQTKQNRGNQTKNKKRNCNTTTATTAENSNSSSSSSLSQSKSNTVHLNGHSKSTISSRGDMQYVDFTQQVIDYGLVPKLTDLINNPDREIQKESCWTLSNIAAGRPSQIQILMDEGVVPKLLEKARMNNGADDVRAEARWAILNCVSCGVLRQVYEVSKMGCIDILTGCLEEMDVPMTMTALEGIDKIVSEIDIKYLEQVNPDKILDITRIHNKSTNVVKRADMIWNKYFVKCQICKNTFIKILNLTKYCSECKCFVCTGCNCEIFHLSYQDQLWGLGKGKKDKKKSQQQQQQSAQKNSKKENKASESQSMQKSPLDDTTSSTTITNDDEEKLDAKQDELNLLTNSATKVTNTLSKEVASRNTDARQEEKDEDDEMIQRYVNFLLETGSIMKLAALMEEDERRGIL